MYTLSAFGLPFSVDPKQDSRNFDKGRARCLGVQEPHIELQVFSVVDGNAVRRGRGVNDRWIGITCHLESPGGRCPID